LRKTWEKPCGLVNYDTKCVVISLAFDLWLTTSAVLMRLGHFVCRRKGAESCLGPLVSSNIVTGTTH
jgi:hypothetical protein